MSYSFVNLTQHCFLCCVHTNGLRTTCMILLFAEIHSDNVWKRLCSLHTSACSALEVSCFWYVLCWHWYWHCVSVATLCWWWTVPPPCIVLTTPGAENSLPDRCTSHASCACCFVLPMRSAVFVCARTDRGKSCNVLEFETCNFQAWYILETHLSQFWKVLKFRLMIPGISHLPQIVN